MLTSMMDMTSTSHIQHDFDRLAEYQEAVWNHNNHYHDYLLQQIPRYCQYVLEVGCGKGELSRLLADRAKQVTACDLSPVMLQKAQELSSEYHNIQYIRADFMDLPVPANSYDCIVSVASLHHLPLESALQKMRLALKNDGLLVILDLFQEKRIADQLSNILAAALHRWFMFTRNRGYRVSPAEHQVWEEHGQRDIYPTVDALRSMCRTMLPGARIRKHLLWRYSLVWKNTAITDDVIAR